jgi:hypothetical protein
MHNDRLLVWPRGPQIRVPAEAINGLTAHTAKARTQAVGSLSVGSRRRSECGWQSAFATVADPPSPAARRSGPSG